MADLKLDMRTVSINTTAAKAQVLQIVKDAMNQVAEKMGDAIAREIAHNGNGSSAMKQDAINLIRTIIREANYERVIMESGIDDEALGGCAEDLRVRVMVVLHGNTASGPIVTKPGQMTFAKGVKGPRLSPLTDKPGFRGPNPRVVNLSFFEQPKDITEGMIENIEKQIEPIWDDAMKWIVAEISSGAFWEPFITIA